MEWIFLVLIAVVIVFGIGVLVWNRRRAAQSIGGACRRRRPPGSSVLPSRLRRRRRLFSSPRPRSSRRRRSAAASPGLVPPSPAPSPAFSAAAGITDATWDDLEEALLRADVGLGVTTDLLDGLRAAVKAKEITEPEQLLDALRLEMKARLAGADRSLHFDAGRRPNVWLFVGVNGVGKTTSIGKVANQQVAAGRRCCSPPATRSAPRPPSS